MLIKPNRIKPTSLHDISTIRDTRRIIIIYKTKSDSYNMSNEENGEKEIFITNVSCTIGDNFYLPKGDMLHSANSYSGIISDIYKPDGSINPFANITIIETYTSNRYKDKRYENDPIRVINYSTKNQEKLQSILYKKKNLLSIEPSIPTYYNMEHQLLLAPDYLKEVNMFNTEDYFHYTLHDFIDENTSIVEVDITHYFTNLNAYKGVTNLSGNNYVYKSIPGDTLDDVILSIFANVYQLTLEYMIEQVLVIFDFQEGSFNIKHVKLKFPETLSIKDEGKLDYISFVMAIDELTDLYSEELYFVDTVGLDSFKRDLFSMYTFISKSDCRVAVVHHPNTNNKKEPNKLRQRTKTNLENDILVYPT